MSSERWINSANKKNSGRSLWIDQSNYQRYVPDRIYQSSVLSPRNLVRATHDRFRRKRFFRKKWGLRKSTKCFLCRKEGHFAKNCPKRSAKKKQYLINSISEIAPNIDLEGHDLESVLSYDSDDNDAICGYSDYDNSSDSSADKENDCCFKNTKMPRHDDIQTPHLPVMIFDPSGQEDPIRATAFIDTGAHTMIINPNILSPSMWLPHQQ